MNRFLYILCLFVFCSQVCLAKIDKKEYKQILKSTDNNAKYEFAIKCFNEEDYKKTITLLDEVSNAYKGTERSENILYLLSTSHFKRKEYIASARGGRVSAEAQVSCYLLQRGFQCRHPRP